MLTYRSFTMALALGSSLLLGACVVKSTDSTNTVATGSGGGATTTTTTTTTTTDTGVGGAGGSTGVGGMGGSTGVGGAGGQAECLGVNGSGMTEAVCDTMQIHAGSNICDANGGITGSDPPPGLGACHAGFSLYVPGAAEEFYYCLSQIGVEPSNACDLVQVQNCVSKVSTESCTDASTSVCAQLKGYCAVGDNSFDEPNCVTDIAPFTDKAMTGLGACMDAALQADPGAGCQDAYAGCFNQATGN